MANFTKIAIKNAFRTMLAERPLSKISVKDIVSSIGINRNTFYYHYQDIPTLIGEIVREDADMIMEQYPSVSSLEEALRAALDFAEKNRRSINHLYNSISRDIFEDHLWRVCDYTVNRYLDNVFKDIPLEAIDRDVLSNFYINVSFGTVMHYLAIGMPDNIDEIITRFSKLQTLALAEMLKFNK